MTGLYHNVIARKVEEQVINLVGQNNLYGLQVIPVQQQNNGYDCGLFAAAFATSLVCGVQPETVHFDISRMRNHLSDCLRAGKMEIFPVY